MELPFLIISLIVNLVLILYSIRTTRLLKDYEEFIFILHGKLKKTLINIRNIDLSGAFESDDEVGHTFDYIKNSIRSIEEYFSDSEKKKEQNKKDS